MSLSTASNPIHGLTAARNRRLVLYYDTTNTIVMKDSEGQPVGNSVMMNVARIITKSAWGKISDTVAEAGVDTDINPKPTWELVHSNLTWTKPEASL